MWIWLSILAFLVILIALGYVACEILVVPAQTFNVEEYSNSAWLALSKLFMTIFAPSIIVALSFPFYLHRFLIKNDRSILFERMVVAVSVLTVFFVYITIG